MANNTVKTKKNNFQRLLLCQEVDFVASRSRYSNRAVTNSNDYVMTNGDRPPARTRS